MPRNEQAAVVVQQKEDLPILCNGSSLTQLQASDDYDLLCVS